MTAEQKAAKLEAIQACMAVMCDHCRILSFNTTATLYIIKDGQWKGGRLLSGIHIVNEREIPCESKKLIPMLYTVLRT